MADDTNLDFSLGEDSLLAKEKSLWVQFPSPAPLDTSPASGDKPIYSQVQIP
jgi:hypothetical protein